MSSNEEYSITTDIIIWGIFAFIFIVIPYASDPLKQQIRRIRRYLGLSSHDLQDNDEVESDGQPLNREYSSLPDRTKNQIDEIRTREISKSLTAYSLELSAENMITRQHDNDDYGHDKEDKEECDASSQDTPSDQTNQSRAAPVDDVEAPAELSNSDEGSYTHICVPLPGYNKNGMRKPKKKPTTTPTPKNKRMGLALFRRENKDDSKQAKELSGVDDRSKVVDEESIQQKDDRREVPIFCAVCLGEFEASERVCWSSNTECTHVFHHGCMLHWLKSVGKRACKLQRFSETPSVKQVMNFDMQCPCCRQPFIDNSVDVCVDGDDENV